MRSIAVQIWHGGSQGFKSPHLHRTTSLVTGLAGRPRRAGAVPDPRAGQQTGSNPANRCSITATTHAPLSRSSSGSACRLGCPGRGGSLFDQSERS